MTEHRNAVAGETLTVHPVVDGMLPAEPAHHAPPAHVHPHSSERFTVVQGATWIRVGRERRLLQQDDSVLVPAGTVHGYRGVAGVPARVLVELDPAGRMAGFFDEI